MRPALATTRMTNNVGRQYRRLLVALCYMALRNAGERVIIDGRCSSVCTLICGNSFSKI